MRISKRLKIIIRMPIMILFVIYLEFGKYTKLESACESRLRKDDKDFLGLYFQMNGYAYQKRFDMSRQYFYRMLEVVRVSTDLSITYKTRKFFITDVIAEEIKAKQYEEAIQDCNELLKDEKSLELKKILKRMLCELNYYLWNFERVVLLCEELNNEFSNDVETLKFTAAYMKGIAKEEPNRPQKLQNKI